MALREDPNWKVRSAGTWESHGGRFRIVKSGRATYTLFEKNVNGIVVKVGSYDSLWRAQLEATRVLKGLSEHVIDPDRLLEALGHGPSDEEEIEAVEEAAAEEFANEPRPKPTWKPTPKDDRPAQHDRRFDDRWEEPPPVIPDGKRRPTLTPVAQPVARDPGIPPLVPRSMNDGDSYVFRWYLDQYVFHGASFEEAEKLALARDEQGRPLDWHVVTEMLDGGATPERILEILA